MSAGDIFSLMEVYNDNATFNGERSTFIPLLSIDPYIVGVFDNDAILYQMIKDDNIAESVYKSLPDFFNCLLALILSKNDDEFMDGLKLTEHNKKIIEQNGLIDKYIEKGVNFRKVY